MSDIGACAVNTKMKCEEKISEAWVGIGEEVDDDATKTTFGTSEPVGNTTEDMLNDAERRIWAAWDKREKVVLTNNSDKSIDAPFHETDDSRLLKDSSSSNNMLSEVDHQERRIEAQNQLLHHAENAMELYGYKADHLDNISTESSVSQLPKPITMIKVHEPSPSKPSFDQRAMLETFSSHLKKEGVEVLKLSRRNKWQVRYLTVSREVTRLDTQEFFTGNIGQCPKALLWPKQRKGRNNSVSSIKGNGRGGLLFAQLTQVELSSSNELYDRHLPRKLKAAFPSYAGAVLDYCFKRGNRKLHFCFKTKLDAEAFVTTMLIIKEAAERMASKGSKKIGSCPTESLRTATKSFDSS